LGHLLSYYSYTEHTEISNFAFSIFRQIAFLYPYLVLKYLDNILSLIQTNPITTSSIANLSTDEFRPVLRLSNQILGILDALRPHIFKFRDIFSEVLDVYFLILNQLSFIATGDQYIYVEFVSKFIDFISNYILYLMNEPNTHHTITNGEVQVEYHRRLEPVALEFLLKQKDLLTKIQELFPEIPKSKLLLNIIQQLTNMKEDNPDTTSPVTPSSSSFSQQQNALLLINKKHFTMLPLSDDEIFEMRIKLRHTHFLPHHDSQIHTFSSYLTRNVKQFTILSSLSPVSEYSPILHYNASQLNTKNRMLLDTLGEIDSISQYEPAILVHFVPQILDLLLAKSNKQVMEVSYQLLVRCLQYDSKQHETIIPFYLDCLMHENSNVREAAIKYSYDLFPFCNSSESKQILLERLFVIAEKEPPRVLHNNLSATMSQSAMVMLTKIIDMFIKIN